MSEVNRLSEAAQASDRQGAADLPLFIYGQPLAVAATRTVAEVPVPTLDATGIVHSHVLFAHGAGSRSVFKPFRREFRPVAS